MVRNAVQGLVVAAGIYCVLADVSCSGAAGCTEVRAPTGVSPTKTHGLDRILGAFASDDCRGRARRHVQVQRLLRSGGDAPLSRCRPATRGRVSRDARIGKSPDRATHTPPSA